MSEGQLGDGPLATVLEPYLARITKRRGNGLSRNMNRTLDYYPISQVICRSFHWLVHAEVTFRFSGVYVRTYHLYWDMVHAHADWGTDVPVIRKLDPSEVISTIARLGEEAMAGLDPANHQAFAGTVDFRRRVSLPYQQFAAAITVARRIGLFSGHGRVGFANAVRDQIQGCVEPHQLSSKGDLDNGRKVSPVRPPDAQPLAGVGAG